MKKEEEEGMEEGQIERKQDREEKGGKQREETEING